jgi:ribosomal protein L11
MSIVDYINKHVQNNNNKCLLLKIEVKTTRNKYTYDIAYPPSGHLVEDLFLNLEELGSRSSTYNI